MRAGAFVDDFLAIRVTASVRDEIRPWKVGIFAREIDGERNVHVVVAGSRDTERDVVSHPQEAVLVVVPAPCVGDRSRCCGGEFLNVF